MNPVTHVCNLWLSVLCNFADGLYAAGVRGEPSLALIPLTVADVGDEAMELNLAGIDALLELEDVDSVEHNMA